MNKIISIIKNPCTVYTFLWCLYYLQGALYEAGSLLSVGLMLLLLVLSIFHMSKSLKEIKQSTYFMGLMPLMAVFTVYGIIRIIFDSRVAGIPSFTFLKDFSLSLLPVFSYYYYTRKGYLKELQLNVFLILFLLVAITSYFFEYQSRLEAALSGATEFTNNSGYLFVALLPLTVFWKRKILFQYAFIGIIILFVIMSMKRGAILSGATCTLLLIWKQTNKEKGARKFFIFLLSIFVILFLVQYAENMMQTSDYFVERYYQTVEGNASGREDMYPKYFSFFINQTSIFSFLFGNGVDSTIFIFGNGAHNDWLEFGICMGVLGLIFYTYYWICFYKALRSMKKMNLIYMCVLMIFVMDFLKSFFSFSIHNRPIYATCALGYCLAMFTMYNKQLRIK